jgi:hypothetical protein
MIPALTNYTKNGFYYQLVERQGDWAIFRQAANRDSELPFDIGMSWEVFKIKVSKGGDMKVKDKEGNPLIIHCEPKECSPGDEMFGRGSAWSCPTLKRAREKLKEAIQNEAQNKERRERL